MAKNEVAANRARIENDKKFNPEQLDKIRGMLSDVRLEIEQYFGDNSQYIDDLILKIVENIEMNSPKTIRGA